MVQWFATLYLLVLSHKLKLGELVEGFLHSASLSRLKHIQVINLMNIAHQAQKFEHPCFKYRFNRFQTITGYHSIQGYFFKSEWNKNCRAEMIHWQHNMGLCPESSPQDLYKHTSRTTSVGYSVVKWSPPVPEYVSGAERGAERGAECA